MLDDQRVQAVLSGHDLVHAAVLSEQPDSGNAPVKGLALVHQLVEIRSLVSAVETAHSDVHDSGPHPRTVIRRSRQGGGETGNRVVVQWSHGLFLGVRTGSVGGAAVGLSLIHISEPTR